MITSGTPDRMISCLMPANFAKEVKKKKEILQKKKHDLHEDIKPLPVPEREEGTIVEVLAYCISPWPGKD